MQRLSLYASRQCIFISCFLVITFINQAPFKIPFHFTRVNYSLDLCCSKCKLEEHKDHSITLLEYSHGALKTILEKCVSDLEKYQSTAEEIPRRAETWLETAEGKVAEITDLIRKSFAEIREAVNKREDEILECIGERSARNDATAQLIQEAKELAEELPSIVECAKDLLSELDSRNPTVAIAEKALSAQEKTENWEKITEELKRLENCEMFTDTERFLREIERSVDDIFAIQDIPLKCVLRTTLSGLTAERVYSAYASLRWESDGQFDEYAVSMRKEGDEWSPGEDGIIHMSKKDCCHCVVYPLDPETSYEFRVKGKSRGVESKWSEALSVRTVGRTIYIEVESIVLEMRKKLSNPNMCIRFLDSIVGLSKEGK